jgi:HAD superfamily hydrolase (TIGR01509 family)
MEGVNSTKRKNATGSGSVSLRAWKVSLSDTPPLLCARPVPASTQEVRRRRRKINNNSSLFHGCADYIKPRERGKIGMSGIDTLLFDFGGVIAEEGFKAAMTKIAERNGLDPGALIATGFKTGYETGFSLGKIRQDRYWPVLKGATGLDEPEDSLTEEILSHYTLRKWMLELVDSLKKRGYRVCMLSDQSHWLDDLNERLGFYPHFDRVFSSYHMGRSKKEVSTFHYVLDSLGARPSATLLIDDHLPNIERAKEAGLATIYYRDRKTFLEDLHKTTDPG